MTMKVDGGVGWELDKVGAQARELEEMGYSGIMTAETSHDPFFPLLVAAQNTENVDLITSIAVAFSRTPMTLANIGHDLNAASKGRFVLGLGSQIRAHITKRFSMPWSSPAAGIREVVLPKRAIWGKRHEGYPLEFKGKFYNPTLMKPVIAPTKSQYGAPRMNLPAVGPQMK
jgi:probable F420-dependent oxidoreductase